MPDHDMAVITTPLREQLILTNGMTLHVVQAGPETGPLVILLHGFPEFWYGWRHQIDALAAAGLRVWIPDQRGYNLSEKPQGVAAYQLATLGQDVLGLIDAAGERQAAIVGHDWGAMVAWWLGMTAPERVSRLAILNVPHPIVFERTLRHDFSQLRRSWYVYAFQIPRLPERRIARDNWSLGIRSLKATGLPTTFTEDDFTHYRAAWAQPGAMTAMINWYRAIARHRPHYPPSTRVTVPTLLIWGTLDIALASTMARPSIEQCDQGRLVLFDDASHWVQHDKAEAVNALLIDHLSRKDT